MSVSASSISGVIAASTAEQITLSGVDGNPIQGTEFVFDAVAKVEWEFLADGRCFIDYQSKASTQHLAGVVWSSNQPNAGQFWIKATQSGVTSPGEVPNFSSALDSWLELNTTRYWGWSAIFGGFDSRSGTVRVDISSDASGTPIVATGYYKGNAISEE
jgi:hypothetical protein